MTYRGFRREDWGTNTGEMGKRTDMHATDHGAYTNLTSIKSWYSMTGGLY